MLTNGGLSPIALLLWIVGIAVALAVYFIPSIVAWRKNHIQTTAIILLNVFLGWTFIGWVVALIWATMKEKNQ
ncbi:MAG: superinfection immunity protein [Ruminococcaceae bacterium]|nr:superinfection immunity protein [Oscillospiraceae bacterium]